MSSQNFSGSVNAKRRKDFLQGLAQSLGLLYDGTNRDIANRISAHFVAHPDLYEQAQYQGLATYRSQPIASNQGKSGKSSAEKDAEDAAKAAKAAAEATG
jgi:hypothetical protein